MEELKSLGGRTVCVYAYIGKEKERARYLDGVVKSASANGIVLESTKNHSSIPLSKDKIMTIKSWESDTWKRNFGKSEKPKVLWGNAKILHKKELEINARTKNYWFVNGTVFALGLVLVIWAMYSLFTFVPIVSHNLSSLGINMTSAQNSNNTTFSQIDIFVNSSYTGSHAALIDIFVNSSYTGSHAAFNVSGIGTNTNVLTATGWHALTVIWAELVYIVAYCFFMLIGLFVMFWDTSTLFNADFRYEIRAYMSAKFDDELK